MAAHRILLLGLVLSSVVSVAWLQVDANFLRKLSAADDRRVTSDPNAALAVGFGDLMSVVCGRFCLGTRLIYGPNCSRPDHCLLCHCDQRCVEFGDCCPRPEGLLGQVDLGTLTPPSTAETLLLASASPPESSAPTTAGVPSAVPGGGARGKGVERGRARPRGRRRPKLRRRRPEQTTAKTTDVAVPAKPEEKTESPASSGGPATSNEDPNLRWFSHARDSKYECVVEKSGTFSFASLGKRYPSYYMLRRCRDDFGDPNVRRLCEKETRLDTPLPVSSLAKQDVFYNQFCALCNSETKLVYWRRIVGSHATLFVPSRRASPRPCDVMRSQPIDVKTCNVTGLWRQRNAELESRCRSTYYPVKQGSLLFQNYYCVLCNGLQRTFVDCMVLPSLPSGMVASVDIKSHHFVIQDTDLSILTDFLGAREPITYKPRAPCSDRPSCSSGYWFDPFREICRKLLCSEGRQLQNESCALSNPKHQETRFRASLLLFPETNTTLLNLTQMVQMNFQRFSTEFHSDNFKILISEVHGTSFENVFFMDASILVGSDPGEDVQANLVNFVNSEWALQIGDSQVAVKATIVESQTHLLGPLSFPLALAAIPGSQELYSVSPHFELMYFNNFTAIPPESFQNLTHHAICPHVRLHNFGLNWTENGMMVVQYEGAAFELSKVTFERDSVLVCYDMLEDLFAQIYGDPRAEEFLGQTEDKDAKIRSGLTIVCTVLSLVCLFVTLCTYCALPTMRSQPGWNNLMLVASLFAAQLTLLFSGLASEFPVGCQVYGVALHFLWLSAIFWMNVCSFHMFRTFCGRLQMTSDSVNKRLLAKYALYAFGVPVTIVAATLSISAGTSSGEQLGYGGRVCYLSSPLLVGLCFVLPLFLVLVANFIFFVITVRAIATTKQLHRDIENERTNVYIYVKLSTLTGLFWTVALLAEVLDFQCLTLLSILLNCSQGIFLFLSFVFNKKILRMCRSRMRDTSSSSNSSSTHRQITRSSKV